MTNPISEIDDPLVYENVEGFNYDPQSANSITERTWTSANNLEGLEGDVFEALADRSEALTEGIRQDDYNMAAQGAVTLIDALAVAVDAQEKYGDASEVASSAGYEIDAEGYETASSLMRDRVEDLSREVLMPGLSEVMEETGDLRPKLQKDVSQEVNDSWEDVRSQF